MKNKIMYLLTWLSIGIPTMIVAILTMLFVYHSFVFVNNPQPVGDIILPPLPLLWRIITGYAYFFLQFLINPVYGILYALSAIWMTMLLKGYKPRWLIIRLEGKH